jgi:hypothetical protein
LKRSSKREYHSRGSIWRLGVQLLLYRYRQLLSTKAARFRCLLSVSGQKHLWPPAFSFFQVEEGVNLVNGKYSKTMIVKAILGISWVIGGLGCVICLTGCDQQKVQVYQVPKEKTPAPVASAASPTMPALAPDAMTPPPGASGIKWKVPAGWEQLPPGQLRVGNFLIKSPQGEQAQMTIIPLAGPAGGKLENVNRWRGQVGLGPIAEEQLAALAEKVEVAGQPSEMFDMSGTLPGKTLKARIVAALLQRGDMTWFFKMTGDDALVAASKPAFVEFVKGVTFGEPSEPAALSDAAPALPPALPTPESTAAPAQNWTVPADWKTTAPGPMQLAKFSAGGKAEVTVASLPGEAGGPLANVNRWRGQIGLAPVTEEGLTPLTSPLALGTMKATLVDLVNPEIKKAMLAAIVPRDGQTWFFKMTGDPAAVAAQKQVFTQFLQSWK